MSTFYKPEEQFVIKELETLKVLADPLRLQILEFVSHKASTVKEIATKVNTAPGKLYYHINLLEKHGLIQVTETRVVSGIIEKQYRATALSFVVERALLTPGVSGEEGLDLLLSTIFDNTKADIKRSVSAGLISLEPTAAKRPFLTRAMSCFSPAKYQEFQERLKSLLDDFRDAESEAEERVQVYGLVVALYPTVQDQLPEPDEEIKEEEQWPIL
jgi:DNA-binding transcriptional ArsR family regulator